MAARLRIALLAGMLASLALLLAYSCASSEEEPSNYYHEQEQKQKQQQANDEQTVSEDAVLRSLNLNAMRQVQFDCKVSATKPLDPIVKMSEPHTHRFFCNKLVRGDVTVAQLLASPTNSVFMPSYRSLNWVPVHRDAGRPETLKKISHYYVGDGTQEPLPKGAQIIGMEPNGDVDYRCGKGPDTDRPPYGCKASEYRVRVTFPNCWNGKGLGPENFAFGLKGCPKDFARQLNIVRLSMHYVNTGGLKGPITVSAGAGEWREPGFFHADILSANRAKFNQILAQCGVTKRIGGKQPAFCRPGD